MDCSQLTCHSNVLEQPTLLAAANLLSVDVTVLIQEEFREALDILLLAEESFQCCKDDLLKYIDNLGLLLMDTVW